MESSCSLLLRWKITFELVRSPPHCHSFATSSSGVYGRFEMDFNCLLVDLIATNDDRTLCTWLHPSRLLPLPSSCLQLFHSHLLPPVAVLGRRRNKPITTQAGFQNGHLTPVRKNLQDTSFQLSDLTGIILSTSDLSNALSG
jgi:hypothetical protein